MHDADETPARLVNLAKNAAEDRLAAQAR
jgi:hypothetical protein